VSALPASRPRLGGPLLYALLALAVFLLAGLGGYVYLHEPPRDTLTVDIQATPAPPSTTVAGSVVAVDGTSVTLAMPDGRQVTLTLPADLPVEDLARLGAALPEGATVNVGVDHTRFGQVLTGIVWIEAS